MNFANLELLQTYWAIPLGALFFLAPGYLLAWTSNFFSFRHRSWPEQILWSVSLSVPTSLVLAAIAGRHLSPFGVVGCFCLIAVASGIVFLRRSKRGASLEPGQRRQLFKAIWAVSALAIVLPLATADIQIGHRIFESTVVYDWAVRVPMVRAAMEGGVPPVNPLSALNDGHGASLRYYYYWYVLVAQLCRAAHIDARAGHAASTVWAAFDFLAVIFLCLKYLAGIRDRLYSKCLMAMLVGCVMGLDIIPALIMLVAPGIGVNIEMEWWHPDRSPSWLSTFLYAPHHIAGIACCVTGFLAVVFCVFPTRDDSERDRYAWVIHSLVAGICFAAAAGTSTFMTFTFVIICALWSIRAILKREWMTIATFAIVAVVAYLLSRTFLHEMGSGASGQHAFAHLALRDNEFVRQTMEKYHIAATPRVLNYILRLPAILLLLFAEFGFFTFVFFHQLHKDFFPRRVLSIPEQALWTIFCGAFLSAFLVSSGFNGPNDLGMHAGMILKFALLLWAAPWADALYRRRQDFGKISAIKKLIAVGGVATFIVGLGGGAYQLIFERMLFPLHETGIIAKHMDVYPVTNVSYRIYDVRDAYQQAARILPADGVLQFNPDSPLLPAFGLYATRQLAAADPKCGTPFGGDEERCNQLYPELRIIFGNSARGHLQDGAAPYVATTANLDSLCRQLSIKNVMADSSDRIWSKPDSWVWTRSPLYANNSVRIIPCGAAVV